jgi:phospholipid/cholesterol/gamma-HCH transport system permease protein
MSVTLQTSAEKRDSFVKTVVHSFLNGFKSIGGGTLSMLYSLGHFVLFTMQSLYAVVTPRYYGKVLLKQLMSIGWLSLPVVGMTALFTGAVLALQIYTGGSRFNAEQIVPSIVLIAILRELGPVLGGLMVAGRVSAAIAAEMGTMRVTEQIDALTTLSTNPLRYLVVPRLIAATFSMPLLVFIGDLIAVMGGYLVSVNRLKFNGSIYLRNTYDAFLWDDFSSGITKAAVFGFIIALTGCYQGYYSQGGAQGVGKATTAAVVQASVLILAANYILTELFFK